MFLKGQAAIGKSGKTFSSRHHMTTGHRRKSLSKKDELQNACDYIAGLKGTIIPHGDLFLHPGIIRGASFDLQQTEQTKTCGVRIMLGRARGKKVIF